MYPRGIKRAGSPDVVGDEPHKRKVRRQQTDPDKELHRNAFPHVIPYLTLDEIKLLMHSLPWTEERILKEIAGGRTITIDDHLLERFPPHAQPDLYATFGHATSVTFRRVEEIHLYALLVCYFQRACRLVLVDIVIYKSISSFPRSLETLKVIGGMFEKHLFEELIGTMPSLHHLHLHRTKLQISPIGDLGNLNLKSAAHLKTLVINSDTWSSISFGPNVLDSVIVTGVSFASFSRSWYPRTRSLYFNSPTGLDWIKNMVDLKSATLRTWDFKTEPTLPSLEHLKIVDSVDPRFRAQFEASTAKVKLVEVHYYDYAPQDQPDLMLNKLNNDCLLSIVKYLNTDDRISFSQTHTRIQKLCRDLYDSRRSQRRKCVYEIREDYIHREMLALRGETLEHVVFRVHKNGQWRKHKDTWPILAGLPKFHHLTIAQYSFGFCVKPVLAENHTMVSCRRALSKVGRKLTKLNIEEVRVGQIAQVIEGDFLPILEELCINGHIEELSEDDVWALCSLKQLRRFRVENNCGPSHVIDEQIVMQLVRSLPHLVRIETDCFEAPVEFAVKLQEYAKQQGRQPITFGNIYY